MAREHGRFNGDENGGYGGSRRPENDFRSEESGDEQDYFEERQDNRGMGGRDSNRQNHGLQGQRSASWAGQPPFAGERARVTNTGRGGYQEGLNESSRHSQHRSWSGRASRGHSSSQGYPPNGERQSSWNEFGSYPESSAMSPSRYGGQWEGQRGDHSMRGYEGDGSFSGYGETSSGQAGGFGQRSTRQYGSFGGQPGFGERSSQNFVGRGSKNYKRGKERVEEDVQRELRDSPFIDAEAIDVEVDDGGVVTLRGTVCDRRSKHLAEDICESVWGCTDVRNELRLERSVDRTTSTGKESPNKEKEVDDLSSKNRLSSGGGKGQFVGTGK